MCRMKILLLILTLYLLWIVIGMAVLTPRWATKWQIPQYGPPFSYKSTAYELIFWPKVLYDINKHKKKQLNQLQRKEE